MATGGAVVRVNNIDVRGAKDGTEAISATGNDSTNPAGTNG